MKNKFFLILSFVLLAFVACTNDDDALETSAVALGSSSINLSAATTPVEIKFDKPAAAAGTLTLSFTETSVVYGTDFSTSPAATANKIIVPFEKGATSVTFTFNKLKEAIEGEVKNVVFKIIDGPSNITISANNSIQVSFNETPSLGTSLAAKVGGALQENQIYIDLSSAKMTEVLRSSWDLGFYSGAEFRVVLNSSINMAAKQLATTNIDEVQVEDASMIISQGSGSVSQIDDPTGNILKTAIAEVATNDADNKVYLIYLGNGVATTAPAIGKEGAAGGPARGWKKIRVLRSGTGYKIQYADIAATTHDEITISKNADFNFTFFSLIDKKTVSVEPVKTQWDISFTTFTNTAGPTTPYFYPDFVLSNLKGGAKAYQVLTTEFTYDAFAKTNVDSSKFTEDQRNIGSNWRSTSVVVNGTPVSQFVLKTDRFYVVKDPAGNIYKLKFTGGANDAGERGYPKFQYAILK